MQLLLKHGGFDMFLAAARNYSTTSVICMEKIMQKKLAFPIILLIFLVSCASPAPVSTATPTATATQFPPPVATIEPTPTDANTTSTGEVHALGEELERIISPGDIVIDPNYNLGGQVEHDGSNGDSWVYGASKILEYNMFGRDPYTLKLAEKYGLDLDDTEALLEFVKKNKIPAEGFHYLARSGDINVMKDEPINDKDALLDLSQFDVHIVSRDQVEEWKEKHPDVSKNLTLIANDGGFYDADQKIMGGFVPMKDDATNTFRFVFVIMDLEKGEDTNKYGFPNDGEEMTEEQAESLNSIIGGYMWAYKLQLEIKRVGLYAQYEALGVGNNGTWGLNSIERSGKNHVGNQVSYFNDMVQLGNKGVSSPLCKRKIS
jgi:hypothetical protein